MITVTEKAKNQLVTLRSEGKYDENYFVRVGVEGGGCSGSKLAVVGALVLKM